jgi:hypothetical protein
MSDDDNESMTQSSETKRCSHEGCRGTMRLMLGPDPKIRITIKGANRRDMEYYVCDIDDNHVEVIKEME